MTAARRHPPAAATAAPGAHPGVAVPSPGRPPTLAPEDDDYLRGLAGWLRRSGLHSAAELWIGGMKPLAFMGGQALHVAAPIVDLFLPGRDASRLATIMEERRHFDRFLEHLGDPAPDDPGGSATP